MNTAQEYPTSLFPINLRKPGKPTQRQKKALLKHYDGGGKRRRKWEMALAQYFPCEAAIPPTIEGGGLQADKSPHTCKEEERMVRGKAEKIPFLPAPPEDGKQMLLFGLSSRDNRYENA